MPPEPLDTIAAAVRAGLEVERSRFLAVLAPVEATAGLDALVAEARAAHASARHHCTALVLGVHGELHRSSDDGEPSGTAGAPMLAALQGAELTDVAAVVTRHFGGTLLGAGGLVRAYGGVVARALESARRVRREPATRYEVRASLRTAGLVEHHLHRLAADLDLDVMPGSYTAEAASFEVVVPDRQGVEVLVGVLAPLDDPPQIHAGSAALRRRLRPED